MDPQKRRRRTEIRRMAATAINAYKLAKGCLDCGFNAHPHALQFDHVDPTTKRKDLGWVTAAITTHAKLQQFLDHVDRYCEVRCANCHAIRTTLEKHWSVRQTPARSDNTARLW